MKSLFIPGYTTKIMGDSQSSCSVCYIIYNIYYIYGKPDSTGLSASRNPRRLFELRHYVALILTDF